MIWSGLELLEWNFLQPCHQSDGIRLHSAGKIWKHCHIRLSLGPNARKWRAMDWERIFSDSIARTGSALDCSDLFSNLHHYQELTAGFSDVCSNLAQSILHQKTNSSPRLPFKEIGDENNAAFGVERPHEHEFADEGFSGILKETINCNSNCNCDALRKRLQAEKKQIWRQKNRDRAHANKENHSPDKVSIRRKQQLTKKLADSITKAVEEICGGLHPVDKAEVCSNAARKLNLIDTDYKTVKKVVENLKSSFESHKLARKTDVLRARSAAMVYIVDPNINCSAMSRTLNLSRNIVSVARNRRIFAEQGEGPWSMFTRRVRSDRFSDEIRKTVVEYWTNNTRVSPNKKDVVKIRIARKHKVLHPLHILEETQVAFFQRFKRDHAELNISLTAFAALKPEFVRKIKDRETCCCVHHMKTDYIRLAINKMRNDSRIHGADCTCKCVVCGPGPRCLAKNSTYTSTSELWRSLTCPKAETEEWYKHSCLLLQYKECGPSKLPVCPKEKKHEQYMIDWKTFDQIQDQVQKFDDKGASKSKKKHVVKLAYKTTSTAVVLQQAETVLKDFIPHNYEARWQAQQFKNCLATFLEGTIVSVIDFAENYTFKIQQEIQSLHWRNDQCTILVHISYRHAPRDDANPLKESERRILKETHFYVSDDREHDVLFVQHCLDKHAKFLNQQGAQVNKHIIWSDGCSSQFKGARQFFYLGRSFQATGVPIEWNYFASYHGKGEHDGAGAVIKRAMTFEMLKRDFVPLQNAHDAVVFLQQHFNNCQPLQNKSIFRFFWEIKLDEVDRSSRFDCATLKGSSKFHSIRPVQRLDPTQVAHINFSCFCHECCKSRYNSCINKSRIGTWQYSELNPGELDLAELVDGPVFEGDAEWKSDIIDVGDNFAVVAEIGNKENADFYMLKCTRTKHVVDKAFKDHWGQHFARREVVVTGTWYECAGNGMFELLRSKPEANVYSHLVTACNFELIPKGGDMYHLPDHLHELIMDSLPNRSTLTIDVAACSVGGGQDEEEDGVTEPEPSIRTSKKSKSLAT